MQRLPEQGAAKSGTVDADSGPIDADLALLIGAWPRLPEAVRTQIMAIIEAISKEA